MHVTMSEKQLQDDMNESRISYLSRPKADGLDKIIIA